MKQMKTFRNNFLVQEEELISDIDNNAKSILLDLLNGLKRAKFVFENESIEVPEQQSNELDDNDDEEAKGERTLNNNPDTQQVETENANEVSGGTHEIPQAKKVRRINYGRRAREFNPIEISTIQVNHNLDVNNYNDISRDLQVLILCPAETYVEIQSKLGICLKVVFIDMPIHIHIVL
jgi:hypothetical protein